MGETFVFFLLNWDLDLIPLRWFGVDDSEFAFSDWKYTPYSLSFFQSNSSSFSSFSSSSSSS